MKVFSDMKIKAMRFFQNEEGASAIEYAVIAGVLVVVLLAGIETFYGSVSAAFADIADKIGGATGTGDTGGDGTP